LWTTDPRDWEPGCTTHDIVDKVRNTPPAGVILLHDGLVNPRAPQAVDRSATVKAVPAIVAMMRSRGLEFATLGDQ
jgi:peptidoglycan/xylan/chitin deacetylase (PgdA/CDA1 family)